MKVLRSTNAPDLYCLWNNIGKEVTQAVTYEEMMRSIIVDEDDWDPGIFKWSNESDFNFEGWQETIILPISLIEHG
ncbi:hypothetical protein [Domibacillus robiginosus]|uniref:hypothetical protein n=1 Tax=Domibacillus robiginosus TaxID=1071054 RepID=UPI00067DCCC6|nr:hypothetical protein [Domibacillus robiginosus]